MLVATTALGDSVVALTAASPLLALTLKRRLLVSPL